MKITILTVATLAFVLSGCSSTSIVAGGDCCATGAESETVAASVMSEDCSGEGCEGEKAEGCEGEKAEGCEGEKAEGCEGEKAEGCEGAEDTDG